MWVYCLNEHLPKQPNIGNIYAMEKIKLFLYYYNSIIHELDNNVLK